MLLLTIALQVLTLMEFVSRQELAKNNETISGLVPGNPKMKTSRPTAERLLSQFNYLNLLIEERENSVTAVLLGGLTMLQKRILSHWVCRKKYTNSPSPRQKSKGQNKMSERGEYCFEPQNIEQGIMNVEEKLHH